MSNRDTMTMYRDVNDQEIERLENRAIETLNYSRDFELDTGMAHIDPSSYEPLHRTSYRR